MSLEHYPRGVLVPAVTPFRRDLTVDEDRFVDHCRWLLAEGANGLAVFGTTSEANSLSTRRADGPAGTADRTRHPAGVLMPGTGCCAFPDTVALTRHAVEHRCFGVLMLPPFYYKGVSDDGIFASVAEVIRACRRQPVAHLSLSHPADGRRRLLAAADRALAESLFRHRRRTQGQLRRLEEHRRRCSRRSPASRYFQAAKRTCSTRFATAERAASRPPRTSMSARWPSSCAAGRRPRPMRCRGDCGRSRRSPEVSHWWPPTRRSWRSCTMPQSGTFCGRRSFRCRRRRGHSSSPRWRRCNSA